MELIKVFRYRNYEEAKFEFHPRVNLITGLNGVGKTTILDIIYYLANGRSYFTMQDKQLYKHGHEHFRIEGSYQTQDSSRQVKVISELNKKKKVSIDDKNSVLLSDLIGLSPTFMIAPKDIRILTESSTERRRLMDKTISLSDPQYLKDLILYNKLLKQRNTMLKENLSRRSLNMQLLESIDERMHDPAMNICEKRQGYTSNILPHVMASYEVISEKREEIQMDYISSLQDTDLKSLLTQNRRTDIYAGRTTDGIHKDDLDIKLNNTSIKKFASQGQLKSTIIAIKLGQMKWLRSSSDDLSILLLDDVFDKLDQSRVESLINFIDREDAFQVFISDTNSNRVAEILGSNEIEFKHLQISG